LQESELDKGSTCAKIAQVQTAGTREVETKVFNQAVKRNIERFSKKFRFQLKEEELENLKSQIVTSSWGGRRYFS